MASMKQMGIKFEWAKHWKKLFAKDSYFLYQRPANRDEIVLRRFTIWNVMKWYFYQALISFIFFVMHPVCRLADKYWRVQEGDTFVHITGRDQRLIREPYWFSLDK